MKDRIKLWVAKNMKSICRGVKTGFILGISVGIMALSGVYLSQGCATVQEFDAATGTIGSATKKVPPWAVEAHYKEMITALKEGKKLKVVWVKKENPIAAWTLGAGMVVGGALTILGIAIVALSQGARLWRGLFVSGAGIAAFLTFYMLERYLLWACTGFVILLTGAAIYFYCFARGMTDKAIETNDIQKGGEWNEEIAQRARKLQGGLQEAISRRAKAVRKRREAHEAKKAKKVAKVQAS